MAMQLGEGETFIEGRSPKKARELLGKAEAAGKPGQVSTTSTGYIVPTSILEEQDSPAGQEAPVDEVQGEPDQNENTESADDSADSADNADGGDTEGDGGSEELFDPSKHNVDEVNKYLEGVDEEERERVFAAERDGKARSSILPDDTEGDK